MSKPISFIIVYVGQFIISPRGFKKFLNCWKKCKSFSLLLLGFVLLGCYPFKVSEAQTLLPDFLNTHASTPKLQAKSWALIESKTGWVITAHEEHERVDPASLTKLMTTYLVFEALGNRKIKAKDRVNISEKAWRAPGSRMFLEVGSSVTVGELLSGLIIQSGNDAAVALAEKIGGSENSFAQLMNQKANALGMVNTHYINASGLPGENHYTTAYDTALISRQIIQDYPDMYSIFAIPEYTYNGITQANRNGLLWRDDHFDGLKTGHTKAAGYCLAGSSIQGNTRFIAIVMGADSKRGREQGVVELINYAFAQYETATIFGPSIAAKSLPLFKGNEKVANIGSLSEVSVVLPRGKAQLLQFEYALPDKLVAPLSQDDVVGEVKISYDGNDIGKVTLRPLLDYQPGSVWMQIVDEVRLKLF